MKLILLIIICAGLSFTAAQENSDKSEIESVCGKYVESWWNADYETMEQILHPDLAKRSITKHSKSGRHLLNDLTQTAMVEYTRSGGGKDYPDQKGENKVEVLHVYKNIATAVITNDRYIDYAHLVKWNGKWKIINVLWKFNKK